jgi:Tol biopolymer transport system component
MNTAKGFSAIFSIVLVVVVAAQQEEFPVLKGRYLGQGPPGTKPERFAPGIVSTEAVEACLCFSHDDRFLVFRRGFREDTDIYLARLENGVWIEPTRAPFFDEEYRFGDFTCSPNEPILYFTTDRPLKPGTARADSANLWKVEFKNGGWLKPSPIEGAVNSQLHDSYPSVSNDKTLFFFRRFGAEEGLSEIMYSDFDNGFYTEPTRIGDKINTQWDEWDPAIAPDGSFLIFCSKKPSGFGRDDLYVSFKTANGGWTDAINLGPQINSVESENRPFITADGKYLFYNSSVSGSRDVYWVAVGAVEKLRPIDE